MKTLFNFLLMMLVVIPSVLAQENKDEDIFLYEFLNGSYHLIGKLPDSERTYSGRVVLRYAEGRLTVVRNVDGQKISGTGKIETVLADEIKVLRVRFKQNKRKFEATYLIDSDLDNYGRLSGHWYREDGGTKNPGLEALFIER